MSIAVISDLHLGARPATDSFGHDDGEFLRFLRFLDQDRTVRVVASTDIDLPTRVHQGHFRLDLAERLMLVQLRVPGRG